VTDSGSLRVSDEQRESAANELREHFAAGRLSEDELDERVQAVYHAQTAEELNRLRADLPQLPVSPRQRKAELTQRRNKLQRRLIQETGGGVAAFLVCVGIWAAAGASGAFWPLWVGLIALIPLVRNGWRLYGPDPELDRVEQELDQRRRRSDALDARGPRHRDRRRGGPRY
jgi:Domain of unknown function (DUF1707)